MKSQRRLEKQPRNRRVDVERFFGEMGWEDVERLDEWDGEDLDALREALSEEEYAALMDHLQESDRSAS